jgi:gliding motility-associated-like protein
MKKKYIFLIFFFQSVFSYSQKEFNIWYFGDHAGINFNSTPPTTLTNGALFAYDQTSTLSDANGNLIMYSNGISVWNTNHSQMPNGSYLMGTGISQCHASVIAKQPGNNNLYYIFGVDRFGGSGGLQYSIVNMSLQGGLGDVTAKNNVLVTPVCEKLTATRHCNDSDIWIITHKWNSDQFYAYLLTASGVSAPVITTIGPVHQGGSQPGYNAAGQLVVSPDGSKIALGTYEMGYFEIYDFDNITGIISNEIQIPNYNRAWGLQFSPDGTKLYTTQWAYFDGIYQFDLMAGSSGNIINSATLIGNATSPDPFYKTGFLQLAPDGKIYVAKFTSNYVGRIEQPNESGTQCTYVDNAIYLSGEICEAGLPFAIWTTTFHHSFSYENSCTNDSTFFYLNTTANIDSVLWNFDDPESGENNISGISNPAHVFSDTGSFNVSLIIYGKCYTDTLYNVVITNSNNDEIIIPNVITPNNDGFNDVFKITNLDMTKADLTIFNRWGKVVFQNKGSGQYWDGKDNGKDCADGVYYWILKYKSLCNEVTEDVTQTGTVTLLR